MTTDDAVIEAMALAFVRTIHSGRIDPTSKDRAREIEIIARYWTAEMRAVLGVLVADPPPALVRAVLEYGREPTEAMGLAGAAEEGRIHGLAHCTSYGLIWRAMIDARIAELAREESDGGQ